MASAYFGAGIELKLRRPVYGDMAGDEGIIKRTLVGIVTLGGGSRK